MVGRNLPKIAFYSVVGNCFSTTFYIINNSDSFSDFKSIYYVGMDSGTDEYDENVTVYLRISIMNGEIVTLQTDEEVYSVYGARAVRHHKN